MSSEPILQQNIQRYTPFPIQYQSLWDMYKQSIASFWTVEEIDLSDDVIDWQTLKPEEQHFIKHVLAFFAMSDGLVMENLAERFLSDVQIPEARHFYSFQIAMESIHGEAYALLLQTYVTDNEEKTKLFRSIETIPTIAEKAKWAQQWIQSSDSFAERLIAFSAVEGIFFSGSFCSIFWLKKRGLMKGLVFSNELISRDEGLHRDFAVELYKQLKYPLPYDKIITIIDSAVQIENGFISNSIPVELIGMNSESMSQYIQYVADHLLTALGYDKYYNTKNPFDWMELISIPSKHNFFERRVSTYQKARMFENAGESNFQLDDLDF